MAVGDETAGLAGCFVIVLFVNGIVLAVDTASDGVGDDGVVGVVSYVAYLTPPGVLCLLTNKLKSLLMSIEATAEFIAPYTC